MKRKIIVGLGIYSVIFLVGGGSILTIIHHATTRLDKLIMLHRVEILRENYLIQIRRVQTDLALSGTAQERGFESFYAHAQNMNTAVRSCFDCHHAGPVLAALEDLERQTALYKYSVSRVLTVRANAARLGREKEAAFRVGEELIQQVSRMIAVTGAQLETATAKALREINSAKYVLYVLFAIGPLVSIGLGLILVTGLTKPLHVLLESTRKLKGGELDHRVAGLEQEFGELADAFNEMAASLQAHVQRQQRAEQMAVLGELAAGLAHEIKNPLAGIKVAMQILAEDADLSHEDQAVVRKVSVEITRLETLMKSFLNFAKPPRPQPIEIQINALLNTVLSLHAGDSRTVSRGGREIEIVRDFGSLPPTLADPLQLQQVFLNLVINAIDAMPEGGTVRVRTQCETDPGFIRVEISDTGTGIDQEHADKIFQPFFTTKHGGTGLGLAVSKQLVEQHGGTISADTAPSGGALFVVRLPVRSAEGRNAA